MKNFTFLSSLVFLSSAIPVVSGQTAAAPGTTPAAPPSPIHPLASPSPKVYTTPPAAIAPVPAADLASIRAALPEKASAEPRKPRKVLVFWRAEGFVHPSIPYGVEAVKQLGEKTGAFASVSSDDMEMFRPETLQRFDGIVFVSTTQLKFENPVHRKALLDFVASGKGVVGIHAASDNFPTWPEGQELMGGVFHGHPWHSGDLVAIKLDDPAHPLNSGFNNRGFRLREEIYQITGPYGRDKERELVSLDMSKPENQRASVTDKGGKPVLVRTDNDFPISWVKKAGEGRVFYTSLGHNKDIYFVPQILKHYLDGIQYALGDLIADDLPTARLKAPPEPALAPEGTAETLQKVQSAPEPPKAVVAERKMESPSSPTSQNVPAAGEVSIGNLAKYRYGDATDALFAVQDALRHGTAQTRKDFGTKFLAILQDPSATPASKQTVCRWLGWMGGKDAVPVLAKLAASVPYDSKKVEESTPGYAIRALATIPAPSAARALLDLLRTGGDQRLLAVMSAVGIRGVPVTEQGKIIPFLEPVFHALGIKRPAIPSLALIAGEKSPALSEAALETLASLRTDAALEAILNARVDAANEPLRDQALINACSSFLRNPAATLPVEVVNKLSSIASAACPHARRLSALRLLMSVKQPSGFETACRFLESGDDRLRNGAAESLAQYATPQQLKTLSWANRGEALVILLECLAGKGDDSYLPLGLQALGEKDPKVRVAALRMVSRCGGGVQNLDILVPLMADTDPSVASAAKAAVAGLKGDPVGEKLLALAGTSDNGSTANLLFVLAARQEHKALDEAIKAASSPDRPLRAAGWEAIAALASAGDMEKCLSLVSTVGESDSVNFQKALVRAALLNPAPSKAALRLCDAFEAGNPTQREILINVLARLEVKEASDKLETVLQSQEIDLRKQVIRALSSSKSEISLKILPEVALNGGSDAEKILALRGYLDTINALPEIKMNEKISGYLLAWKLATRNEEKDAIRSAVKNIKSRRMPKTKEATELLEEVSATASPAPPAQP